jgi:hypothetical protein
MTDGGHIVRLRGENRRRSTQRGPDRRAVVSTLIGIALWEDLSDSFGTDVEAEGTILRRLDRQLIADAVPQKNRPRSRRSESC